MEFPDKGGAVGMREEAMEAGVSWKSWVGSRDGGKHQTLRRREGGAGCTWRWSKWGYRRGGGGRLLLGEIGYPLL
jgi:hypothetical protein